jgi:hypothetical protein
MFIYVPDVRLPSHLELERQRRAEIQDFTGFQSPAALNVFCSGLALLVDSRLQ